ncbi:MAG: hypothetical protein CMB80_20240 [Flammeovirgaceae bacterium]|nr:hypothetical protein [Flammeovirgaceae bacterium]MBE61029.1 hypothetical protein [Flammeovirgaceae bacterium]HCX21074.1 hypothetical protein [Cytophagales bacterium]
MPKSLIAALMLFCSLNIIGQNGDYPITHHEANIKGLDFTAYDLTFDQYGLMYAATSAGILRYDGVYWDFIETPSATFSVLVDEHNDIYVGAMGGFGQLELTESGLKYEELGTDSLLNHQFTDILDAGDSIMFVNGDIIFVYHPGNKQLNKFSSPDKWPIEAVMEIGDSYYVTTRIATYEWKAGSFSEASLFENGELPIKVKSQGKKTLVLDYDGAIHIQSNNSLETLDLGVEASDFMWVNDSMFIVSTRNHGSLLVNYDLKKVSGRINYETGLPDDEIEAIEVDWNQGIWFAHQFGFSRVDPNSPVACLSNIEGLQGNLVTSDVYQGKVIIGSSSGLFRAVQDSIFEMSEKATRLDQSSNDEDDEPQLKEVKWIYERIPGINNKVNALQNHHGMLLVGTNEGLFEYDGEILEKIASEPVRKIESLPRSRQFVTVDEFKVHRFEYNNGEYTELPFGLDDQVVVSTFGDTKSIVWLVGTEKLSGVGLTYQGASTLFEVDFPNRFMEIPTICELDKGLYFITSQGYFQYNYQKNELVLDEGLMKDLGKPVQHKGDPNNGFWVYDGKLWKHVAKNGESTTYPYLSLFPDLRYIHQGDDGGVYFINSDDNKFYYYRPGSDSDSFYDSNIFYKHLFAKSAYTPYLQQVHLDYDQNYLRAEVGQPDYLGLLKVEYQYQLEGMDDEWSEWSDNNHINLNFLPEGKFTLKVRSRDVFGRVQSIDPILLVVDPPYWQTTWFYFLEVLFFATLVLISTRLNQGKATNRFLTEGLTVLTIVIIIETLQSAAGSFIQFATSPFIDFLINLCIALVIFPLELLLKKIIKSGKVPVKLKGSKNKS